MKREIGGNILKFLFFLLCVYGIVRVSIWSYFQTQAFFIPFDAGSESHIVSHALSLLTQYGQNVVLFLAAIEGGRRLAYNNKIGTLSGNKIHSAILEEEVNKSQVVSNIYYLLFAVFAIIDAGTNLGQFFTSTVVEARKTIPAGFAMGSFMVVGSLISVVVVFVEELFMSATNAVLHAFNDILESLGIKRFSPLDLFVDPNKVLAMKLEERNGRGSDNSGSQQGNSGNQNQNTGAMQNLPRKEQGNGNNQSQNNQSQQHRPPADQSQGNRNSGQTFQQFGKIQGQGQGGSQAKDSGEATMTLEQIMQQAEREARNSRPN